MLSAYTQIRSSRRVSKLLGAKTKIRKWRHCYRDHHQYHYHNGGFRLCPTYRASICSDISSHPTPCEMYSRKFKLEYHLMTFSSCLVQTDSDSNWTAYPKLLEAASPRALNPSEREAETTHVKKGRRHKSIHPFTCLILCRSHKGPRTSK
jgi:hypothetical protein